MDGWDGWIGWDISQTTRNTRAPGGANKDSLIGNSDKIGQFFSSIPH